MATVQKILEKKGHEVFSIDADANTLDAAHLMNERRIGALVVVSGEKVIGIFTERDLLNRVVAKQCDPKATLVRDVMTSPVSCCDLATPRSECRVVMRSRRIRHLPVVENERLVGIISIGDILAVEDAEQQQTIHHLYEYINIDWK